MRDGMTEWWQKFVGQDRGQLMRLIVIGLLGVVLLGWAGLGGGRTPSPAPANPTPGLVRQEAVVGNQLAGILRAIPGVGTVQVAVTLTQSIGSRYATDTQGAGGGAGPVVVSTGQGEQVVPLDEVGPVVGGVVVVARSAANPAVRAELFQAVETLLQVQPYQVLVLPN